MSSNLSFILKKPLEVEFAERPRPQLSGPNKVLIAVNYTGICGSDVHYYDHGAIGSFVVKEPMVLGHESAGTVVEVSADSSSAIAPTTLKKGDRVAVEPGYPCRHCEDCLAGHYNLCAAMVFAATPPHDGTLAGFWVAPADFCHRLPDHVSTQEGALAEPLAVAVHITRQAQIQPGQSVVVMGAGPVGLLCAAVAAAYGASTVVSVDIVQSKLDFALGFGATHAYLSQRLPPADNAAALLRHAGIDPAGADVVIEASGAEPSTQAGVHALRRGGVFVQGGMGRPDISFPILELCIKEATLKGSFRYGPGDYKLAVALIASGRVPVKKLISATVPFAQAEAAFKKVKEGQVIKILIAGPNENLESSAEQAAHGGHVQAAAEEQQGGDGAREAAPDAGLREVANEGNSGLPAAQSQAAAAPPPPSDAHSATKPPAPEAEATPEQATQAAPALPPNPSAEFLIHREDQPAEGTPKAE